MNKTSLIKKSITGLTIAACLTWTAWPCYALSPEPVYTLETPATLISADEAAPKKILLETLIQTAGHRLDEKEQYLDLLEAAVAWANAGAIILFIWGGLLVVSTLISTVLLGPLGLTGLVPAGLVVLWGIFTLPSKELLARRGRIAKEVYELRLLMEQYTTQKNTISSLELIHMSFSF